MQRQHFLALALAAGEPPANGTELDRFLDRFAPLFGRDGAPDVTLVGPKGERVTDAVPHGRPAVQDPLGQQLDQGRQAYVIYPLVEESEKIDLKSATEMADHLQQEVFPAYRVALLHGRMKADVKEQTMRASLLYILVTDQ